VLAAMLGALVAPRLATLIGAPALFATTGLILIAVAISRPGRTPEPDRQEAHAEPATRPPRVGGRVSR